MAAEPLREISARRFNVLPLRKPMIDQPISGRSSA